MLLVLGAVLEDLFKFSEMIFLSLLIELKSRKQLTLVLTHFIHEYSHSHRLLVYHWTASGLMMAFF